MCVGVFSVWFCVFSMSESFLDVFSLCVVVVYFSALSLYVFTFVSSMCVCVCAFSSRGLRKW